MGAATSYLPGNNNAGAAITDYRVLQHGASAGLVIMVTAITDNAVGVGQGPSLTGAAATGDTIAVVVFGQCKIEAGAAIEKGETITFDSVGRAITYAGTGDPIGSAFESASAAGDVIDIFVGGIACGGK